MTDFDSDDFLRQLHDKLHDYGADPPAETWAGIQSRLPTQKKDRRLLFYLSAAAALLLLGVLGLGSWLYFGSSPMGGAASGPLAARTVGGASAGGRARPGGSSADAVAQPAAAETSAASAAAAASDSYARAGAANRSSTPLKTASPQRYTASGAATSVADEPAEDALAVVTTGKEARARAARNGMYLRRGRPSGQLATRSVTAAGSLTAADETIYGSSARASRAKASGHAARYASATGALRPDEARPGLRRSHQARRHHLAGAADLAAAAAEVAGAPGRAGRAGRLRAPGDALEPVAAAVARPEPEEPEVRRTKRNRAPRPTRRARILKNLTFNTLAGSALSYRQLSAGGTAAQRQLANLERPALGYSAHVGLAYALNKRAKVSLGLGYTDYATRYLYQVQKGDGVVKVDQRDVYRYVTLPLQLQYQLAANHRYSVGWLAGASLGAYAGGRTTTGTACNCLQRDANTEAYRPWALAATAGGFLEYYLTPDVRLLLRPTLQYQLTSITDATAGLPARRPWSVGLQTGLSFNLQDKPRPGAATAKR